MRNAIAITAALAMLTAFSASAQESASGRYTMTPSGEDMLRLDTKTGAVSRCAREAGTWICESVADDQKALQNEIDRLSIENERLASELARAGRDAPPGERAPPDVPQADAPQPDAPQAQAPRSWLPDDAQMEELTAFFKKIMRRFKQMAEDMQADAPRDQP